MAFTFPENPTDLDVVEHEGRSWQYSAVRNQWQNVFSGASRSSVEDIGFDYDPTLKLWHLDVGVMVNV